jgi:probable F420-dependent oxidoreductase
MAALADERWGVTVPLPVPLLEHRQWYADLASWGYTDVWSLEANAYDGVTPLALAAAWEPSLRLGTAILSTFTRGPAVLAQTAATMAHIAPGRFALGLGSSSDVLVRRMNGIAFDRPYQRTADVVRFLRRALAGERVTEAYETFAVDGFQLADPPAEPPELLVAALRPRMLALAGTDADGVILNWLSADDVRAVVPHVLDHNAGAEVVARIMVCPTADRDAVRRAVAPLVATYLNVPVYRAFHEWLGRADALAPVWEAWDRRDRAGAVAAVSDAVIDELCVSGDAATCRARLDEYVANGVTLLPVDGDVRRALEALAPRHAGVAR